MQGDDRRERGGLPLKLLGEGQPDPLFILRALHDHCYNLSTASPYFSTLDSYIPVGYSKLLQYHSVIPGSHLWQVQAMDADATTYQPSLAVGSDEAAEHPFGES
jgi:hypothetical protein